MSNEGYNTAQEAITVAEAIGWVDDFDGMNCNDYRDGLDDCGGWDGVSRRCDCGNRRVYWATGQYASGKFYAYAEAY